jgi:hypothetical protein
LSDEEKKKYFHARIHTKWKLVDAAPFICSPEFMRRMKEGTATNR